MASGTEISYQIHLRVMLLDNISNFWDLFISQVHKQHSIFGFKRYHAKKKNHSENTNLNKKALPFPVIEKRERENGFN